MHVFHKLISCSIIVLWNNQKHIVAGFLPQNTSINKAKGTVVFKEGDMKAYIHCRSTSKQK